MGKMAGGGLRDMNGILMLLLAFDPLADLSGVWDL